MTTVDMGSFTDFPMDIESFMKDVDDETQRRFLQRFLDTIGLERAFVSITPRQADYEIIVVHRSSIEGYTGGAEQYFLDKITGKWKMGWHEHPMAEPVTQSVDLVPETLP